MPHDLAYFKQNAARCEQLAREESDENMRKLFLDIAAKWRQLGHDEIHAETKQGLSQPAALKRNFA
jgi:hypothetical protein